MKFRVGEGRHGRFEKVQGADRVEPVDRLLPLAVDVKVRECEPQLPHDALPLGERVVGRRARLPAVGRIGGRGPSPPGTSYPVRSRRRHVGTAPSFPREGRLHLARPYFVQAAIGEGPSGRGLSFPD